MGKKERNRQPERPLPLMFVGDDEPITAKGAPDELSTRSLVAHEAPRPAAEETRPDPAPADAAAVWDADFSLPGCLAWVAMTVCILGFLKETDLPGQLELVLALVVLLAAPGLYWWSTTADERRRTRRSRGSPSDSPPAQITAPPPEDPPAVP